MVEGCIINEYSNSGHDRLNNPGIVTIDAAKIKRKYRRKPPVITLEQLKSTIDE
jgi:hypothetical protein